VSRPVAIVDTNVIVAGLLTARDTSPVARVLDGMLRASMPFVISEALLAAYHAVLVWPGLRRQHGLTVAEVENVLTAIAQHAVVLRPASAIAAPDPGDQLLWDLLAARPDLVLVSGDRRLIEDPGMKGRVVTPAVFLAGV
jgi:predicted nucleic acid-binding protein